MELHSEFEFSRPKVAHQSISFYFISARENSRRRICFYNTTKAWHSNWPLGINLVEQMTKWFRNMDSVKISDEAHAPYLQDEQLIGGRCNNTRTIPLLCYELQLSTYRLDHIISVATVLYRNKKERNDLFVVIIYNTFVCQCQFFGFHSLSFNFSLYFSLLIVLYLSLVLSLSLIFFSLLISLSFFFSLSLSLFLFLLTFLSLLISLCLSLCVLIYLSIYLSFSLNFSLSLTVFLCNLNLMSSSLMLPLPHAFSVPFLCVPFSPPFKLFVPPPPPPLSPLFISCFPLPHLLFFSLLSHAFLPTCF